MSSLKVVFDDEKAKAFFTALRDIQRVGIKSLLFNISKEKEIKINSINESRTVMSFITLNSELLAKSVIDDDFKFGIYDVNELVALTSIFSDGYGLSIQVGDNESVATIKKAPNTLKYYGSNVALIKEAKIERTPEWLYTFKFDDNVSRFVKALSIVGSGFVIITGDPEEQKLKLSITDKDIKTNAFETIIDAPDLDENIRVVLDKEHIIPIVKSSISEFELSISKPMVRFVGKTDMYEETHYVSSNLG